jgi:hypothetical protein
LRVEGSGEHGKGGAAGKEASELLERVLTGLGVPC